LIFLSRVYLQNQNFFVFVLNIFNVDDNIAHTSKSLNEYWVHDISKDYLLFISTFKILSSAS